MNALAALPGSLIDEMHVPPAALRILSDGAFQMKAF